MVTLLDTISKTAEHLSKSLDYSIDMSIFMIQRDEAPCPT